MLRSLFLALSAHRGLRAFSERSSLGQRLSRRFVAGLTVPEALAAARQLNSQGFDVSLDALGESVTQPAHALAGAQLYHQLLDAIHSQALRSHVSLKLTQMGLDIDPALAETIVADIVHHAARIGSFVRIDMEGSAYTEATLDLTERLHHRFPNAVGTVLQASLRRTSDDLQRLLRERIRIRLCKGAYREPDSIAFPHKSDVDQAYIRLMQRATTSGIFCGIATHDPAILDHMRRFAAERSLAPDAFEFQMLYGVRRDLQRQLLDAGFRVRVYVPFGPDWYPYFMRRLAERPANVLFLARNLFRA